MSGLLFDLIPVMRLDTEADNLDFILKNGAWDARERMSCIQSH